MPRSVLATILVGLLMTTAGCSRVAVARGVGELLFVRDHFLTVRNLRYGQHDLHLDVHRPAVRPTGAPVILFLYGGRWQGGSKDDYRILADALTKRGWVVVIPAYRLHPRVDFPAWVEDAADAVRWTRDHVARFGGDPTRIHVIGHSAGAHTAALLAVDERYLRNVGVDPQSISGYVSLAGPVDTTWTDADVQRLMGPAAGWPATYPRTYVDGREPPLLLLHGADDDVVHPANSARLAARIQAAGGCARHVALAGLGHLKIIVALAIPRILSDEVSEEVARFVADPRGASCTRPSGGPT